MQFLETKIPPPLVAMLFGVAMWGLASNTPTIDYHATLRYAASLVLCLLGFLSALMGVLSFRKANTTVNPLQPDTSTALVVSGMYQITRNPMYLGMALVLLGWAAFLASLWSIALVVLFILYIQRWQILPEERAMEKLFGAEFSAYRSQVRRWL